MSAPLQQFYTPEQIASLLRIDHQDVDRLINNGSLRAYQIASQIRISGSDLQAYLDTVRITANGNTTTPPGSAHSAAGKTCATFGGQATFTYHGSITTGTTFTPGTKATYKLRFTSDQWQELLTAFSGRTVRAGLNFASPETGSLGAWIKEQWHTKMGPAAYVGGILINEGYATREKPGWITFYESKK
jgi:excisionase family DNA binding protein